MPTRRRVLASSTSRVVLPYHSSVKTTRNARNFMSSSTRGGVRIAVALFKVRSLFTNHGPSRLLERG